MTLGQRKIHKFTWLLIAIAIPILIFFSIKNLNFSEIKEDINVVNQVSKRNALKVAENEIVKASLFDNSIEIILKTPLKRASIVVYAINEKGLKGTVLGQISTVGIYVFKTKGKTKGIVIFDKIKEVEITKLYF